MARPRTGTAARAQLKTTRESAGTSPRKRKIKPAYTAVTNHVFRASPKFVAKFNRSLMNVVKTKTARVNRDGPYIIHTWG